MAIRVLSSEKSQRTNRPTVAISPKLKRLLLNKHAYDLLCKKYGKKVDWAQLLIDDDVQGVFWVKPTPPEADHCKRLDSPSKNTRSLSITILLNSLKWSIKETTRYNFLWDDEQKAGRVDTNQKIDGDKGNADYKV